MSKPDIVEVVVYDDPAPKSGQSCACGCGGHDHGSTSHDHDPLAKVSMEYQTKALALTLEAAFPGQVKVTYINVLHDPEGAYAAQAELLRNLAYPSPLVYINGQGRFAGALPVERIREEVAHHLASQKET